MDFIDMFFLFIVVPIWAICFFWRIGLYFMGYRPPKRNNHINHDNDWIVNDEIQKQWDESHKKAKED